MFKDKQEHPYIGLQSSAARLSPQSSSSARCRADADHPVVVGQGWLSEGRCIKRQTQHPCVVLFNQCLDDTATAVSTLGWLHGPAQTVASSLNQHFDKEGDLAPRAASVLVQRAARNAYSLMQFFCGILFFALRSGFLINCMRGYR